MFSNGENYQNLLDMLRSDNCTLDKVIEDPGFSIALRNDSPDLINFLTQEKELDIITHFALSGDIEENDDLIEYKKMMRHSMDILTSTSRKLQNFLINNNNYIQYLRSFPSTKAINSAILCANYAKIIDYLIQYSQGRFLETDYPNIVDVLIEHIDNLSFQMLFVKICCDYASNFNVSYDLVKKLIDSPKHTPKIYTLTKIVNDKSSLISFLNIPEILQPLYELVVQTYEKSDFLCTETCKLLLIIIKATQPNDYASRYEVEYSKKIDFTQPLNYSSAAIISLFPKSVNFFIDRFFINEDKCTTQINQSILDALRKLNKFELQEIAFTHDIFKKIMDFYQSYIQRKINGHFFQIIQLFITNQISCPARDQKRWTTFIQQKFAERYQSYYGGRTLKDFVPFHSQPFLDNLEKITSGGFDQSENPNKFYQQNVSNSDTNVNYTRTRCQSHQDMSHIHPYLILTAAGSSSSSESSGSEYDTRKENGKPPISTRSSPTSKKSHNFNITRISKNSNPNNAHQTSSSSSIILIPPSVMDDSAIHIQPAVNPIKIEVTAQLTEVQESDEERKLMSKSLDQNAMRSYITGRFTINKLSKNHHPDKYTDQHNS